MAKRGDDKVEVKVKAKIRSKATTPLILDSDKFFINFSFQNYSLKAVTGLRVAFLLMKRSPEFSS
jgi:hypothetical protein